MSVQKSIENILVASNVKISIFEFREVCERFAGLTTARANNKLEPFNHEKEIFRIAGGGNQELSALCLHRRNQKRLYFHQTEAEKDFLQIIAAISDSIFEQAQLKRFAVEFADLLNNSRARKSLTEMFDVKLQRMKETPVKDLEKILWMPVQRKPPTASKISKSLRTIKETAKLSAKD